MPVAWLLLLKATLLRKLHFTHLRFDQLLTSSCRGRIKLNYQCWTPDFLISSSLQSCWTMIGHGFFLSFFSIVKVTVKCLTVRVGKPVMQPLNQRGSKVVETICMKMTLSPEILPLKCFSQSAGFLFPLRLMRRLSRVWGPINTLILWVLWLSDVLRSLASITCRRKEARR